MTVSIPEVVRELHTLTPDRVAEVYDFVLFLKSRQNGPFNESDEWTNADLQDATIATMRYAEQSVHEQMDVDDAPR